MFKTTINFIYVILVLGLINFPNKIVWSQEIAAPERYQNCIELSRSNPDLAIEVSKSWLNTGGGFPASHCYALALANQGFYIQSAKELEKIAQDITTAQNIGAENYDLGDPKKIKTEVLAQAGNTYLLANQFDAAEKIFTKAYEDATDDNQQKLEILIDRSRARAEMEKYEEALVDLDEAQLLAPERVDIFIYKASAKRLLGRYGEASQDVDLALFRDPENKDGLLERANLRRIKGDIKGAREDWEHLIALYPNSLTADIAQKNLDKLSETEILVN